MGAGDILYWLRAKPFRPFRITLISGRKLDIRHPELVKVMRTSLVYFTPTAEDSEVYERGEMFGLVLIEHIEPIDAPSVA